MLDIIESDVDVVGDNVLNLSNQVSLAEAQLFSKLNNIESERCV